jgi:putative ABC transport system substrate-binding protein
MKRRQFIAGLSSAVAWPAVARAQQPSMPVVGFLNPQSADGFKTLTVPFFERLRAAGYIEGQNLVVEYRYAEGRFDRLPALALDLVGRGVAVIVTIGEAATLAAKAATTTIPIVFQTGSDPVKLGLVAALNRPGANATGITLLSTELAAKRLEVLRELIPNRVRFGVLADPLVPDSQSLIQDLLRAALTLNVELVVIRAATDNELEEAFTSFLQRAVGATLVVNSTFYNRRVDQLVALAARHSLPTIFPYREFVLAGGLLSYGSGFQYLYRQAGIYTARILKGENPADLPVDQATRIELTLNLKTAKALGIEFPTGLLVRADEVIE